MASGVWDFKLAGTEAQRHRLKIPLVSTPCGRDSYILWQVDIGTVGGVMQQVIKGSHYLTMSEEYDRG